MTDAHNATQGAVYSCRCLNVRIYPNTNSTQTTPPELILQPEYTQVYVGEDGIQVAHPHVTLRTRTRGVPIEGTSRCSRYTTLTCLICEDLVYRVYQTVPIDLEGKEGPLLPTEDWVENEIMKSLNGWVEVSCQCLMDDAVMTIESSPDLSPVFSIILPKQPPLSPTTAVTPDVAVCVPRTPSPNPPVTYLDEMKPWISPPPFTPSHPVFLYLASKAGARSEVLRSEAEEYISRVVREKLAEVENAEDELRDQVEALWFKFKAALDTIKKDRSKTTSRNLTTCGNHEAMSDAPQGARVAIREFVPTSPPAARAIPPSEASRVSALSVSLATSSFHHPRAVSDSKREANGSMRSQSTHSSGDSVRSPPREGAANVLQFPRNIDDNLNTAVSFKYFLDLEEEIGRKKKERLEEANREYQPIQPDIGPSQAPAVNGKKPGEKPKQHSTSPGKHVQVDTEGSIVEVREKSPAKGKRHVTFDVEPEVVTINSEANKGKVLSRGGNEQDPRDMIFEFEDVDGESAERSSGPTQILPLLEQPIVRPSRHRKARSLQSAGLPQSFSSLRPVSLPGPSHIRPPRSPRGVDSSSQNVMMSLPKPSSLDQQTPLMSHKHVLPAASEDELDPRDAALLRLVAADTPSHRGAWKPDSEAWRSFTQPPGGRGRSSTDVSEDEDDSIGLVPSDLSAGDSTEFSSDDNAEYYQSCAGVPGSLPIPISQQTKKKASLSLASYQPKAPLVDHAAVATLPALPPKHTSAAAFRRASYAERDRQRALDPGALDFATETDEAEGESSEEETEVARSDVGTRSRKQALKILQKSSEVPEEGMWRSLAV